MSGSQIKKIITNMLQIGIRVYYWKISYNRLQESDNLKPKINGAWTKNGATTVSKIESYNITHTRTLDYMSDITDFSFPEMFASMNTGRDSSDRVLKTIIEGLLTGRYQPGERVVARQLA